ncbi:MAG: CPBP family intramembrane metalloprotease [Bacteroidia bacterium]|nr:CPBP family intramembrane metalloprotease [Bacteroidia bacterium]
MYNQRVNDMKITVFGSARPLPGEPDYEQAYRLGQLIAHAHGTTITGGYGGTMAAVSAGAQTSGGHVIGVTCTQIEAWRPTRVNEWVNQMIPAPVWFWELFNKIFENDFGWWGAFIKVAVTAPVVEELIFRGIILQGLRRNYNAFVSVFISALLFALFHLNPWQFPATFVLGLLLGWIMLRTQNIFLSILGHSINNFLVLITVTYWEKISSCSIYLMDKKDLHVISILVVSLSLILIYLTSISWFKKKIN